MLLISNVNKFLYLLFKWIILSIYKLLLMIKLSFDELYWYELLINLANFYIFYCLNKLSTVIISLLNKRHYIRFYHFC